MNRWPVCPNMLLRVDRQVAADHFGATRGQSVSDLAADAVSNLTGGLVGAEDGKHMVHAGIGAPLGVGVAQLLGVDKKLGGAIGALVSVAGIPLLTSLPGDCGAAW